MEDFLLEIVSRCHQDVLAEHFTQERGIHTKRLIVTMMLPHNPDRETVLRESQEREKREEVRHSVMLLRPDTWPETKAYLVTTRPRLRIALAQPLSLRMVIPPSEQAPSGDEYTMIVTDLDTIESVLERVLAKVGSEALQIAEHRLATMGSGSQSHSAVLPSLSCALDHSLESGQALTLLRIRHPPEVTKLRVEAKSMRAVAMPPRMALLGEVTLLWEYSSLSCLDASPVGTIAVIATRIISAIEGEVQAPPIQLRLKPKHRAVMEGRQLQTCCVRGLELNQPYLFTVWAENARGRGKAGECELIPQPTHPPPMERIEHSLHNEREPSQAVNSRDEAEVDDSLCTNAGHEVILVPPRDEENYWHCA